MKVLRSEITYVAKPTVERIARLEKRLSAKYHCRVIVVHSGEPGPIGLYYLIPVNTEMRKGPLQKLFRNRMRKFVAAKPFVSNNKLSTPFVKGVKI